MSETNEELLKAAEKALFGAAGKTDPLQVSCLAHTSIAASLLVLARNSMPTVIGIDQAVRGGDKSVEVKIDPKLTEK